MPKIPLGLIKYLQLAVSEARFRDGLSKATELEGVGTRPEPKYGDPRAQGLSWYSMLTIENRSHGGELSQG